MTPARAGPAFRVLDHLAPDADVIVPLANGEPVSLLDAIAASSPIDRHGYFSLGVSADYTASFIGKARFFLEANSQMPRTFGRNQLHVTRSPAGPRSAGR